MPIGPDENALSAVAQPTGGGGRHGRWRAAVRQLLSALLTLLVIWMVTFAAVNVGQSGRSVARQALGYRATPYQVTVYVQAHHLDEPIVTRYVRWLGDFVQGNWGYSVFTRRPVM